MTIKKPTAESAPPAAPHQPRPAESRAQRRFHAGDYGSWWWALPALAMVFCIHYLATAFGGYYSFTDWNGLGPATWVGIDNFVAIFNDPQMAGAVRNTLVIAIVFVVVANVIGLLFALALNRTLKSRYLLRVLLFAPVVLSSLAVSYVFRFIFAQEGALNALLEAVGLESWQRTWLADPTWAIVAIMTVLIWQNVGLTMVIYLAGLATVPQEQEEAAAVDGASMWQRFRHVVMPGIQPAVAIATTLTLVNGLRVFDQVMAMTGGGPFGATDTLATVVYRETFAFGRFGYGAALSLTLTFFVVVAAGFQLYITRRKH
ncbi:sugar ABC transporter permease [Demequina sp. SYSU T00039]|uniref:Sugar ABC transporter permease n=1 Tax=Demequina lignilytica TaxID=3051663 RepID=A0AAW7M2H3_9MICO|nr:MULTISPECIES: sugar ABC transporter permease [unclassified Demequina]MDN4477920.1 sugar ABC transporter permease [Demequina sp. SYSU T00039-1]MDN4487829.1 sugar ABC transporter permease [Demequina sp. SYSU T00039]MDN4490788.1 sugar ABC transporter permease [Demequina sp. SYSU T00068]